VRLPASAPARPGLSLLEVLVAMAIFLMSLIAIGRLLVVGTDVAQEIRDQNEALQICQSKLAEVVSGGISLDSQGETPYDDVPDSPWKWSLDCEQGDVSGIWNVTVHALRSKPDGTTEEVYALSQMVLDPSLRGSTFDSSGNTTSSGTGGSGSQPGANSGSSSGSGTQSSGGSPSPSSGGGGGASSMPAKPSTPTPTPTPSPTGNRGNGR
jgi:general secretion pathway protein I